MQQPPVGAPAAASSSHSHTSAEGRGGREGERGGEVSGIDTVCHEVHKCTSKS